MSQIVLSSRTEFCGVFRWAMNPLGLVIMLGLLALTMGVIIYSFCFHIHRLKSNDPIVDIVDAASSRYVDDPQTHMLLHHFHGNFWILELRFPGLFRQGLCWCLGTLARHTLAAVCARVPTSRFVQPQSAEP